MRFYIASGLSGADRVRDVAAALVAEGHVWTYDWTRHGSVQHETPERKAEVASREMRGVIDADVVVVLLPGGRGTHVELGAALALGKPAIIASHAAGFEDDRGIECVFYSHPRACKLGLSLAADVAERQIVNAVRGVSDPGGRRIA